MIMYQEQNTESVSTKLPVQNAASTENSPLELVQVRTSSCAQSICVAIELNKKETSKMAKALIRSLS